MEDPLILWVSMAVPNQLSSNFSLVSSVCHRTKIISCKAEVQESTLMMPRQLLKASINTSSSNHKISSASNEEKGAKMEVVAIGANDFEYLKKQDGGAVTKYTDICAR